VDRCVCNIDGEFLINKAGSCYIVVLTPPPNRSLSFRLSYNSCQISSERHKFASVNRIVPMRCILPIRCTLWDQHHLGG